MRSSFYQSLLSRLGPISRRLFSQKDNETLTKMKSIRCSSTAPRTKKGLSNTIEIRQKMKNALSASSTNIYSKIAKPNVIQTEDNTKKDKPMTELRILPGVGKKNAALLTAKGLTDIESLQSIFTEKFDRKDAQFVEYLHEEVGILHKIHCQSIAGYVAKYSETSEELKTESKESERLTFCVEGNISAGKSSFLKYLSDKRYEICDLCEFVREPVEMWQKVGGNEGNNILQRFYEDPKTYAYEFQNYVFLSRLRQNRRTFNGSKPLRVMERSVLSDRLVFVRAVHEANWMDDNQLELYDSWYNPLLEDIPGLVPDGFIYLRANPETCLRRLKSRGRFEESSITNEYLEGLHKKHEDWFNQDGLIKTTSILHHQSAPPIKHISTEQNIVMPRVPVPKELDGCLTWLGTSGILSDEYSIRNGDSSSSVHIPDEVKAAVRKVPSLILEYDNDFDLENDAAAKLHYAKKVKTYFEFVKTLRKTGARFYQYSQYESRRIRWDLVNNMSNEELGKMFLSRSYEKPRVLASIS